MRPVRHLLLVILGALFFVVLARATGTTLSINPASGAFGDIRVSYSSDATYKGMSLYSLDTDQEVACIDDVSTSSIPSFSTSVLDSPQPG